MKTFTNIKTLIICILPMVICFNSCEGEPEIVIPTQPELPPIESMVLDLSSVSDGDTDQSTRVLGQTRLNIGTATIITGFWNIVLFTNMVVPVTAFKQAFLYQPEFNTEEQVWQWTYSFRVLFINYQARLTADVGASAINWTMYLSTLNTDTFQDFKWFEGTSTYTRTNGQWILYHSPDFPDKTVQIDWQAQGDSIGDIKFTYIRETDNDGNEELSNGSFINIGIESANLEFYDLYYYDDNSSQFETVEIEVFPPVYDGRIRATNWYGDRSNEWHCWDSLKYDIVCN